MKKVWKYGPFRDGLSHLVLRQDSEILSAVLRKDDYIYLYVLHEYDETFSAPVEYVVSVITTGRLFTDEDCNRFLGTFVTSEDNVVHVWVG